MAQIKDMYAILRKKYPVAEYALMQEVSDAAGFHRSNSADYIVVNLWPSRGLAINGIELKSFRSDWLSELKKPHKAENIFQYCDYFWLLTTDDTIAKMEEIPVTWGWMCVSGSKIIIKKDAPKLTPVPLDKHFMVAMLKRACDKTNFVHIDTIQDKIEAEKTKAVENALRQKGDDSKELQSLRERVRQFEEASGVSIGNSWSYNNSTKIGDAVNFLLNGGVEGLVKNIKRLKETSDGINNNIAKALDIDIFKTELKPQ